MIDTPIWLAGWYATRLHAVDRPFDPDSNVTIQAMCNAHVYATPRTEWAARRLAKNLPKCKRCLKLLGERAASSEVEQLRAEIARLRLSEEEREAVVAADSELSAIGHHRTPDKRECLRISNLLRALLARLGGAS